MEAVRYLQKRALWLAILVVSVSTLSACGADASEIALGVAKDWSSNQVDVVSAELGKAVVGDQQILATLAGNLIEDQIQGNLRWTYSTPIRTGENRYTVKATAQSSLGVSIPLFPDKNYDVSIDFRLDIDTSNKRVTNTTLDISSLRIVER